MTNFSNHDTIHDSRSIDLDADVRSASVARGFIRDTLESWGRQDVEADACLAVSELVTNAVVHAKTTARVRITYEKRVIHLEVVDCSPQQPVVYEAGVEETNHRGMHLVDSISKNWGINPTATGKVVWLDLTD